MDGPLSLKLAAYSQKLRELNFPFAEAYDSLVARLIAGGIGDAAPKIGDPMPPFVLPSRNRSLVALDDLLLDGPVVISFNRGHWCPFCKIELRTIAAYIDNGYALSLGLVLWLGDTLKELMRGRGLHLETIHGNDGWFVPLPATFVVAADGTVAARHVDPDFRQRMEIDEILAALRDLGVLPEGGAQ
jgi:peroxiredoxin